MRRVSLLDIPNLKFAFGLGAALTVSIFRNKESVTKMPDLERPIKQGRSDR